MLSLLGARVPFLIWELVSCKLHSAAKTQNAWSSLYSPRGKFARVCILAKIPHNSDTDGHLRNVGFFGDMMPLIVLKNTKNIFYREILRTC